MDSHDLRKLLLQAGDIETNPGPKPDANVVIRPLGQNYADSILGDDGSHDEERRHMRTVWMLYTAQLIRFLKVVGFMMVLIAVMRLGIVQRRGPEEVVWISETWRIDCDYSGLTRDRLANYDITKEGTGFTEIFNVDIRTAWGTSIDSHRTAKLWYK